MQQRGSGDNEATPPGDETPSRPLRFRTESQVGRDSMERRWAGIYSYGEGWARFGIVVDLALNTLTLQRSPDADYGALLSELSGKSSGRSPAAQSPESRVSKLSLDAELVGLKLSRASAGTFQAAPAGDWVVIQAFIPGGTDSFLLGLNDRLASGELYIPTAKSVPAVMQALIRVFG